MPAICSRRIRLTASIRICIRRKLGTIRLTTRPTQTKSAGTTTASSHPRPASSRSAITTPPTIISGEVTAMMQAIATSICTCCTSLVVRVISEGAPKAPHLAGGEGADPGKSAPRRSRPRLIAVRAPNQAAPTEPTHLEQRDRRASPPPTRTM